MKEGKFQCLLFLNTEAPLGIKLHETPQMHFEEIWKKLRHIDRKRFKVNYI